MFDIAYETEASIEACTIITDKLWNKLKDIDISIPFNGFVEMQMCTYFWNKKRYWQIMYGTHGT